jgi:hypothetical protein
MKPDAFKPQGQKLTINAGAQPQELGQNFRISGRGQQTQAPPMVVGQGGDRFVAASSGVRLAGQPPVQQPELPAPRADAFRPASPTQSVQQQLGATRVAVSGPQRKESDTLAVYIDGTAPDGTQFSTDAIIAEFPAGSVLSGIRYEKVD